MNCGKWKQKQRWKKRNGYTASSLDLNGGGLDEGATGRDGLSATTVNESDHVGDGGFATFVIVVGVYTDDAASDVTVFTVFFVSDLDNESVYSEVVDLLVGVH